MTSNNDDAYFLRELENYIPDDESRKVEFKSTFPKDSKELANNIASFATSGSGIIYLGVDRKGRASDIAVDDHNISKDELRLRINGIARKVHPTVKVKVDFFPKEGKNIVRIGVDKGNDPVYYVNNIPYIRDNSESRPANPGEVEELYNNAITGSGSNSNRFLSNDQLFKQELDVFVEEESVPLMRLKMRGYYRVIIRPTRYESERLRLQQVESDLIESIVPFRRYHYPHYYGKNNVTRGVNHVQWSSNIFSDFAFSESPISIWRMYQSGQFIHYFGLMEDYWHRTEGLNVLGLDNTTWTLTEIYEFAARLASRNVFDTNVYISIDLNDMKDRQLVSIPSTEISHSLPYHGYKLSQQSLPYSNIFLISDLINRQGELAVSHMLWILERLGDYQSDRYKLQQMQRELYGLRSKYYN